MSISSEKGSSIPFWSLQSTGPEDNKRRWRSSWWGESKYVFPDSPIFAESPTFLLSWLGKGCKKIYEKFELEEKSLKDRVTLVWEGCEAKFECLPIWGRGKKSSHPTLLHKHTPYKLTKSDSKNLPILLKNLHPASLV